MDIIDNMKNICNELDEVQDYISGLPNKLSIADSKKCDLEHFIEHNRINSKSAYRICREMQNVLWERRKIKNDMEIGRTLTLNLNKLIGNGHRQFLLAELNKSNNRLNQKYNNRIYTKAQEEYLLGGEYNEEIEDMERRDSNV